MQILIKYNFGKDLKNMEEGFREGARGMCAFIAGFLFSFSCIFISIQFWLDFVI